MGITGMTNALSISTQVQTLVPAVVATAGERASLRFLEFFASNIRNVHTRRAYSQAVSGSLTWCEAAGLPSITAVQPLHVAAWIELQTREHSTPTAKQRLSLDEVERIRV